MKRLPILVLILVAAIVPIVSGCGTPNVVMTIDGSAGATAQALLNNMDLTLTNIHVHDAGTDEQVLVMATSTIDLVDVWNGQDVQVFAGNLPAGTYTDLTMTFTHLKADGDLGELLTWSYDGDFPANTTAVFSGVTIEVTEDGTVDLTWDFDYSLLLEYEGGSFSAYGSVSLDI